MENGKLYSFLKSLQSLLTTHRLEQSQDIVLDDKPNGRLTSSNENMETKTCMLEGASYDLFKNLEPNKKALENASYDLFKNIQDEIEKSYAKTMSGNN